MLHTNQWLWFWTRARYAVYNFLARNCAAAACKNLVIPVNTFVEMGTVAVVDKASTIHTVIASTLSCKQCCDK